jgi:hypothetical protein
MNATASRHSVASDKSIRARRRIEHTRKRSNVPFTTFGTFTHVSPGLPMAATQDPTAVTTCLGREFSGAPSEMHWHRHSLSSKMSHLASFTAARDHGREGKSGGHVYLEIPAASSRRKGLQGQRRAL